MCCDCEVMDFDGENMNFMMGPSNLNIYEHRFINTSTIPVESPSCGGWPGIFKPH